MFERYTQPAKRVIYYARVEANHRDETAIGAEDILLGLTWEMTSGLADMPPLKDLAIDLRAHMGVPHLPSTIHPYLRERIIPLDSNGKKALAYAAKESDRDRQYWIDCDHLLRGLLRFPNPASDALLHLGITLAQVRDSARSYRLQTPPAPSPPFPRWRWLKRTLHRTRHSWILLLFLLLMILISILLP
jgi:ATP-dependent Clp protease ATP-binding subunit ClpC